MTQLVNLYLYQQSADHIQAQVLVSGSSLGSVSMVGVLPFPKDVVAKYQNWRSTYLSLQNIRQDNSRAIVVDSVGEYASLSGDYISTPENCDTKARLFRERFDEWLRDSRFIDIRQLLTQLFSQSLQTKFVICTDNAQLQQLPWVLWELLKSYPAIEVSISGLTFKQRLENRAFPIQMGRVKILAILGDSVGINIQDDREFLEALPAADVEFLPTPERTDLHDRLWEQPRDILFFAGHSSSQGATGKLRINQQDELSLDDIEHALERMARNGLTLAIFNSCDGLGLAKRLAKLPTQVPYIIVMREPVPDAIAQTFLKYFLATFSQGKDFHGAVRDARERLERLNTGNLPPYGDWMPIIWQNPLAEPPVWPQPDRMRQHQHRQIRQRLGLGLGVSAITTLLTLAIRWLGGLQSWEMAAYDRFVRSQTASPPDQTTLIVKITESELDPDSDKSISDASLEALLTRLYAAEPRIVGLDIFRDFSIDPEHAQLSEYFANGERLITLCGAAASETGKVAVEPSPAADPDGIGFSDIVNDADRVYRRHLLAMDPQAGPCQTDFAFATLLAFAYLKADGIELIPDSTAGRWIWGDRRIPLLKAHQGGYHREDMAGDSILLNYRIPRVPGESGFQEVTLTDVLAGNVSDALIRDRIVLIGTDASSIEDETLIPLFDQFGKKQLMPGVVYQAHAANQLVDIVLGRRRLLRPAPRWIDSLIILGLTATGSILGWRYRRLEVLGLWSGIVILGWYGTAWIVFIGFGLWLPLVPGVLALGGSSLGFWLCDRMLATLNPKKTENY